MGINNIRIKGEKPPVFHVYICGFIGAVSHSPNMPILCIEIKNKLGRYNTVY